jgi:hypothetical protein
MIYLDNPFTLANFIDYLIYDIDLTKSNPITKQVQKVSEEEEFEIKTLLMLKEDCQLCFNGKTLDLEKAEYKDITNIESLDLEIRKFRLTASPSRHPEAQHIPPVNLFLVSHVCTNIPKQIKYYMDVTTTGGIEFVPEENFTDPTIDGSLQWVGHDGLINAVLFRDQILLSLKEYSSFHTPTGKFISKYKRSSAIYNTPNYWMDRLTGLNLSTYFNSIIGQIIFNNLPPIYANSEFNFDITIYDDSNPDDPQDFTWQNYALATYGALQRAFMVVRNINQAQSSVLIKQMLFDSMYSDPIAAKDISKNKDLYYQISSFVDTINEFTVNKYQDMDFDIASIRLAQLSSGEWHSKIKSNFKLHVTEKKEKNK